MMRVIVLSLTVSWFRRLDLLADFLPDATSRITFSERLSHFPLSRNPSTKPVNTAATTTTTTTTTTIQQVTSRKPHEATSAVLNY
ncbi:hypothetical protein E2C01_071002 [Portunus trituberculatus]|uniref:Uncharacterized protein n=1 Tax=Portunus trituberculatus TaxID=210409 RepID=A0A5B7I356_PORTR|nr:hypothetical protein [Portunus trituberculatus]